MREDVTHSKPDPEPTTEEGGKMKIPKTQSRVPIPLSIKSLRPTVVGLATALLVVASCDALFEPVPVFEPEPAFNYTTQDERSGRTDEVVLGVVEPEREPGRINDLAAPDCASRSSDDRSFRGGRIADDGCSREAQSTGPLQGGNPSFKGGPGCAIQCITSGVAYARGAGARLVVTADTYVQFTLNVWNEEENYFATRQSDLPLTMSWGDDLFDVGADFLDLKANTTYQASVQAVDASGYISTASGKFTTLRRFAEVDFGSFMLDSYAPEFMTFRYYFGVDGTWQPQLDEVWQAHYLPHAPAGVRSVIVEGAPQWLPLAVQVVQTIPSSDDLCEPDFPKNFPHLSGTSGCWTWDTAYIPSLNLDDRPAGATSWTEWTLQHHLNTAGFEQGETLYSPLDFTAPVTVKVWFKPAG
jgi:hypothetical protein